MSGRSSKAIQYNQQAISEQVKLGFRMKLKLTVLWIHCGSASDGDTEPVGQGDHNCLGAVSANACFRRVGVAVCAGPDRGSS